MSFKLWSELNKEAAEELKPDFGFISWNNLSKEDKRKVWKYLEASHFFDTKRKWSQGHEFSDSDGGYYQFYGSLPEQKFKQKIIGYTVHELNNKYKSKSYARGFLENPTYPQSCADFYKVFIEESENVVLELMSFYAQFLIDEKEESIKKNENESKEEYEKRKEKEKWFYFDNFAVNINEVFSQFNLSVYLTRLGFAFKQEDKLIKEVFYPVINSLSNPQWKEVNKSLADAFTEYQKNTSNGFSNSVTNAVTSVQAFLQILCNGKTGVGDISKLIPEAQKKNLIPTDFFTKSIFKNIESILMQERQNAGIAHPKEEYANEKNARLVLNLAMVFFQHCLS